MKKILFPFLALTALLIISCSSEPKTQIKDGSGKIVENRGPIFQSDKCKEEANAEAMRQCGDVQLSQALEQTIIEAHGAGEKPLSSKLVVEFDVLSNGKPANVKVSRGISADIDRAATSLIKKTRWQPAIHDGTEQKIHKRIPITIEF